jgi:predicted nucleic acid-binding protein
MVQFGTVNQKGVSTSDSVFALLSEGVKAHKEAKKLPLESYISCMEVISAIAATENRKEVYFVTSDEYLLSIKDKLNAKIKNLKILSIEEAREIAKKEKSKEKIEGGLGG